VMLDAGNNLNGSDGAWKSNTIPPSARSSLALQGVDLTDAEAVRAFYAAVDNGVDGAPFWLESYLSAHGLTLP
jgi:hypothetical protein